MDSKKLFTILFLDIKFFLWKEESEEMLFRKKVEDIFRDKIWREAGVKSKKICGTTVPQNLHSEKYPRQIPKATRLQARNSLEEKEAQIPDRQMSASEICTSHLRGE